MRLKMQLKEYFSTRRGKQSKLAVLLGVSRSQMSQMVKGTCAISNERCVIIEEFTSGEVSRKDLCPNDWIKIWPELAQQNKNSEEAA
jgi:DNA-binding transcriptional regulator YdaS (Cro superfamily)